MLPLPGEPDGPESLVPSKLPGRPGRDDSGRLSAEEGGGVREAAGPRLDLGGTGGTDPTASDRERLRLGRVLPTWLGLRPSVGVACEVRPSSTVKQMDSWESLRSAGAAASDAALNWTGAVLRRLKTVLGLGMGFMAGPFLRSRLAALPGASARRCDVAMLPPCDGSHGRAAL